jgi:hypothetical protein
LGIRSIGESAHSHASLFLRYSSIAATSCKPYPITCWWISE